MRSTVCCTLALIALFGCTSEPSEEAPAAASTAPSETPPPAPAPPPMTTFAEPVGDAVGAGIDLSDTKVVVDEDGMLLIEVALPDGRRADDHVQIYLDVDRDYENNGYDVRLVFLGDAARLDRFDTGKWRNRTPASYEASFDHGIHIRVPIADVGIEDGFDFFVASIDESTGKVSDLSPDGALWQRWTYTR